jgi:ribosome biogenesis GTPase
MLKSYGWTDALQDAFTPFADRGLAPARVVVQQRGQYRLAAEAGELTAELAGRFAHEAEAGEWPVAGDWVAATVRAQEGTATIRDVLPRRSAFVRRAAGRAGGAQVVAANADVAFLAAALNGDLNLRRLERYLALAHESGAEPVVVLTKADLCDAPDALVEQVRSVALAVPVLTVSAVTGQGLDALAERLPAGATAVLLGSSGVGKSTLVNALSGEARMATRAIREEDGRGRHTTTHRELVRLPSGGLLLDTPGMRELGMWEAEEGVGAAFADIDALAADCRFSDCGHGAEPGCAVRAAVEAGLLEAERLAGFGKLKRELAHLDRREDPRARLQTKKQGASRSKALRAHIKTRRGPE